MNAGKSNRLGLILLISYMFLEYVRPQSFIPGLAALHIPMFVQIAIIIALLRCNLADLKSRETVLFFLFISLMAWHIPFARNNYAAFWTTRTMVLQFIIFLGIVGFLHSYKRFNLVLTFWIVIAVLCAAKGFFEGGRIPGSAFLQDENDFSLFLNMMIPLAFFKGTVAPTAGRKVLFYTGFLILILGTIASTSRGGFVGLLPPLLYCWWKSAEKIKSLIVAAVIGFFLLAFVIPQSYWDEMKTITGEGIEEGTGAHRIYMWKHAWSMFCDHPVAGVGPGNYSYSLGDYEPPEGFRGRSEAGRAVHSVYFTLLSELGLAGTFLFFGMIWINRKESAKLRKLRKRICLEDRSRDKDCWGKITELEMLEWGFNGAMIAYLVSGAFLSVLYYGHFWLILGFSVARINIMRGLLPKEEFREPRAPHAQLSQSGLKNTPESRSAESNEDIIADWYA